MKLKSNQLLSVMFALILMMSAPVSAFTGNGCKAVITKELMMQNAEPSQLKAILEKNGFEVVEDSKDAQVTVVSYAGTWETEKETSKLVHTIEHEGVITTLYGVGLNSHELIVANSAAVMNPAGFHPKILIQQALPKKFLSSDQRMFNQALIAFDAKLAQSNIRCSK